MKVDSEGRVQTTFTTPTHRMFHRLGMNLPLICWNLVRIGMIRRYLSRRGTDPSSFILWMSTVGSMCVYVSWGAYYDESGDVPLEWKHRFVGMYVHSHFLLCLIRRFLGSAVVRRMCFRSCEAT